MSIQRISLPKSKKPTQKQSKTAVNTPIKAEELVKKPKNYPMINTIKQIEDDDYCDLSIIITNEEIYPERSSRLEADALIQSAKQSLIELQFEAKCCMDSSKRLLNDTSRKIQSSFASSKGHRRSKSTSQIPNNALESLKKSIYTLNKRLSNNEDAIQEHVEENSTLKIEIIDLQSKVKEQKSICKLESAPVKIGCTCEVM